MNLGEAAAKKCYDQTFMPMRPTLQYDALVYVTNTTPIEVLPEYYAYWNRGAADQL
ncbi:MAG: hypothetical protein R3C05_27340 [Pirellulaceae bacterium]